MLEDNEQLERKLEALVNGAPLEDVMGDLPEDEEEIRSLISIAAAIRDMEHPLPSKEQAQTRLRQIQAEAKKFASLRERQANLNNWLQHFRSPSFIVPAFAMAALVVMLVAFIGVGIWLAGPRSAQYATLDDVTGKVEVISADAAGWRNVVSGDKVYAGERIRTGPHARVILRFFDGSQTSLVPNSDLTILKLDGGWGNELKAAFDQHAGKTNSNVIPFDSDDSYFWVNTPSGSAHVHGTTFSVSVKPSGPSRFAVDNGEVLVKSDNSAVTLRAGQVTRTHDGEMVEAPTYQFSLQGELESKKGSTWTVAGVPYSVMNGTLVIDDPQVGDEVTVEGHVLVDGEWIADVIERVDKVVKTNVLNGILNAMDGNVWEIGRWSIQVDKNTVFSDNLVAGMGVRVEFTIQEDGHWLAQEIQTLDDEVRELVPTKTHSPQPELEFGSDEVVVTGCSDDLTVAGVLKNNGQELNDFAAGVVLNYEIIGGGNYISKVQLLPSTWETVGPGQQVEFAVRMVMKSEWVEASNGAEAKVRVYIEKESNRPDNHPGQLTVILDQDCQLAPAPQIAPIPTATLRPSPTRTIRPTLPPTPDVEDDEPKSSLCTGAQPHPTGILLAEKLNVPYYEIMTWFCLGYGFSDIETAYDLSYQTGLFAHEIFAMYASVMDWSKLRQQLLDEGYVIDDRITPQPTAAPLPTIPPLPTAAPSPTEIILPTSAPTPTVLPPLPTATPLPTLAPIPTNVPDPTSVPVQTSNPAPTDVPDPTDTSDPTDVPDPTDIIETTVTPDEGID